MIRFCNEFVVRLVMPGLLAVSCVLLPGAISPSSAELKEAGGESSAATIIAAIETVSQELPYSRKAGFDRLARQNPMLMLRLNSQRFETRHAELWK